jgi:hypothetical protein
MTHITPMTPNARRTDLGTFKKQLIEAQGPVFDGLSGLLLLVIIGFILAQVVGAL